jgi:hypothetical protein
MRVEAGEMMTYYILSMSASFESAILHPCFAATAAGLPASTGEVTWLLPL